MEAKYKKHRGALYSVDLNNDPFNEAHKPTNGSNQGQNETMGKECKPGSLFIYSGPQPGPQD